MGQPKLRRLASLIQANPARLTLALTVALLVLCVALKSTRLDNSLSSWIQRTSRVDSELAFVEANLAEGAGSTSQLLLQTPRNKHETNVLSVESLMVHLEALAIATHVTVDLYDVSWSLKDLCFTPTIPDYDGLHVSIMLDHMMPCAIKTPLDCFWEGAKLHGPEQPITLGSFGPKFKWTTLEPLPMVELLKRNHPHASFPYDSLLSWMRRVGITSGYQNKPCLDPTDPNCPETAPNKLSQEPPNIGAKLTGGCRGLATNQMHWKEEEIVGGLARNKSGYIVQASALQSTIQLMGEQDVYDYWRKTSKVQDINNWTAEKAKLVLETWQHRFKEELSQFTRTSRSSSDYKLHAMTSKSMLEPIDIKALLDLTNLEVCFILMTLFTLTVYPNLFRDPKSEESGELVSQLKTTMLALVNCSFVGLTFIGSLGLSSFMNLPFNMATTQILPPLALFYGFNQNIVIAKIYARNIGSVSQNDLTASCLKEILPVATLESIVYVIALLVATIIPVPSTRVFAFQFITYVSLATLTALTLTPSIMATFLVGQNLADKSNGKSLTTTRQKSSDGSYVTKIRSMSPCKFVKKGSKDISPKQESDNDSIFEEQIFSRLQDDLKKIQSDNLRYSTGINFSARMDSDGIRTSFEVSSSPSTKHIQPSARQKHQTDQVAKISESMNNQTSCHLPDLISDSTSNPANSISDNTSIVFRDDKIEDKLGEDHNKKSEARKKVELEETIASLFARTIIKFKYILILILIAKLYAIIRYVPTVKYGLHVRDIVARDTLEYESFQIQEGHFPVYNIFAITKGNFDYPTNQNLLYKFYKSMSQVEGVLRDEDSHSPRFWLVNFRDWLIEIQESFDSDRNKSLISGDGWNPEASDASKLAYKLLAQTGRMDNPIDKGQVESNRLVDANGIINPKAFYYYLAAWVINDPFTYATSEANFKPEPKVWNDNPNDLRIEKARPLVYAQIPYTMKLSTNSDDLHKISEMRRISQEFEQQNLPNFPTGIPFIFWDQFINLGLVLLVAVVVTVMMIFVIVGLLTTDFRIAAIICTPILLVVLDTYSQVGRLAIPFNNIVAVLLMGNIGIAAAPNIYYTISFQYLAGDRKERTRQVLHKIVVTVLSGIALQLICCLVFYFSRLDFMIQYSQLLFSIVMFNTINSLLVTPFTLILVGPDQKVQPEDTYIYKETKCIDKVYRQHNKVKHRVHKKRSYPRFKSEISLSTISEEPQTEAHLNDIKLDFSIRCY